MAIALAWCASSPAQTLTWTVGPLPPPLHPSVIMVDYNGKSYPVTAVAGEVPEIEVEGKLVRLRSSQTYDPQIAAGFGRGFIRFERQASSSQVTTMSYRLFGPGVDSVVPGGAVSASGEYKGTIIATEAHSDCFIAILFFRKDAQGLPDTRSIKIAFGNIGEIAAGREIAINLNCAYIIPGGGTYYLFPMVFSKGVEIRSDQCEIEAHFFHQQEAAAHAELVTRYRHKFANADHSIAVYMRYPPLLPDDIDPRSLPAGIQAKFSIMETGEVDSLEIIPALDPRVDRALRRAINGWLFLPQLRKGIPVRVLVNLPLSFGAPSS